MIGKQTKIAPNSRQRIIVEGKRSMSPSFVVIDCETTGFGKQDRIVEIAAVTLDGQSWETVDEYDTLINPERDTGPAHIHGIRDSMVEDAPVFSDIAAALVQKFQGAVLIAHNFRFDSRMLGYEFGRLGVTFYPGKGLCTMQACGGEKLSDACNRYRIELNNHHAALADARAAAALAKRVLKNNSGHSSPARFSDIPFPFSAQTLSRFRS